MSDSKSKQFPYRTLGYQLRSLREKNDQSVLDVSGAVEIEEDALNDIEKGSILPSEDILLLLISHFGLQNEAAMKLWKLAGYDKLIGGNPAENDQLTQQSAVLLLPIDARIIYTDDVQISTNNYGIVMNFMQASGQKAGQPLPVAKVGMSKEHAEKVIHKLKKALSELESKDTPANKKTNDKPRKSSK